MVRRAIGGAVVALILSACGNSGSATGPVATPTGIGSSIPCPAVLPAQPPVVLAYPASGSTQVPVSIGTLYFQPTNPNVGEIGIGIPVLTPSGSATTTHGTTLVQAATPPPNASSSVSAYETTTVPALTPNTTYTISLISAQDGCTVATALGTFST
jgi:hypothetical protein